MMILMVPVTMACALGGTVGLIWLIRRFAFKQNNKDTAKTGTNEGRN